MRELKNFRASNNDPDSSFEKYEGMSEGELMGELMRNVSAAKENGTFSAEQIDEFVEFVSPGLDANSRKRLLELVAMIKG